MDVSLLLLILALWDHPALPGLSPEDQEVIRNLELLQNLDLTRDLELFVAPAAEPEKPPTSAGDDELQDLPELGSP